jgi:uncharacterized membrane protein
LTLHEAMAVFFAAMLPYIELRGAIPLAISLGASPLEAFIFSVIGNLLPVLPIMLILPIVAKWADRNPWVDRFFKWLTNKVGRKKAQIVKYGPIGLTLFVAIPLPVTGAWTGAIIAFLLGIRKRHAFFSILAGVLIAGLIVTALSVGASLWVR